MPQATLILTFTPDTFAIKISGNCPNIPCILSMLRQAHADPDDWAPSKDPVDLLELPTMSLLLDLERFALLVRFNNLPNKQCGLSMLKQAIDEYEQQYKIQWIADHTGKVVDARGIAGIRA